MTDFRPGWAVMGNDDRRVGTIKSVGHNYILTSRPGFAPDIHVPVSYIANVEHETVHLNITQGDTVEMGWEQAPREDEPESDPGSDLHRHI